LDLLQSHPIQKFSVSTLVITVIFNQKLRQVSSSRGTPRFMELQF